jgi:hypothetical protein
MCGTPAKHGSAVRWWRRAPRLGLLSAVAGLAAACAQPPPPADTATAAPKPPLRASTPAGPCVEEYSALLDLADLARSYGKSSGVFFDPLGDLFDELDQCLSAAQGAAQPARANLLEISGPATPAR